MINSNFNAPFSRRRALAMGAGLAGSVFAETALAKTNAFAQTSSENADGPAMPKDLMHQIEQIIQAQGSVSDGVFSIEIDRNDITDVTLHGVPILPAFMVNGNLTFQMIDSDRIAMNADMAFKASELAPAIHQMISHNIVFQAEHQHMYDFKPLIWFIHFRAVGNPVQIAKGVKAVLNVTSTPFPQTSPKNPTSPLPAMELGKILGAKPSIGSDGVVNFNVPRAENMRLGGMRINPYLNVMTPIAFQPHGGGANAAAIPDFGMIASEINDVVGLMQNQGWDIGCLYNQETDEHPQLYFSHQFKTGNAIELAKEIRKGLNRMNMKFV